MSWAGYISLEMNIGSFGISDFKDTVFIFCIAYFRKKIYKNMLSWYKFVYMGGIALALGMTLI